MITLKQLEELRKKLRNKYIFCIIITLVITIILVVITKEPIYSISMIMFGYIITYIFTNKLAKEYSIAYKNYFVKTSLEKVFENLKYQPDNGIPCSTINSTNMIYTGTRYSSNDLITGNYKTIGFTQSDIHIQDERTRTDSNGNTKTYYVTIFKGRWMIFDFNKSFKSDVQVTQKGFENSKITSYFSKKNKFQKVEMESQEFNEKFNVYAKQPLEAFYILTPRIMEKILTLDKKNEGKLLLCFVDKKLHVGIYDNNDSFEHKNVFKDINKQEIKNNISKDIQKITMFIDELELNNDLFKRTNIEK